MIVVKLELWPHGNEKNSRLLGIGYIANDGTGTTQKGNYTTVLRSKNSTSVWKTGTVKDFKRLRFLGWDLLYLALKDMLEDRHEGKRPKVKNNVGPTESGCDCSGKPGSAGHS